MGREEGERKRKVEKEKNDSNQKEGDNGGREGGREREHACVYID